jgi:A/G-specific adenine glycosylase
MSPSPEPAALLLAWYDRHRRELPWRAAPGETADPYHVWLSEIMLQQTQVATVIPYFQAFLARWPTLSDLATASLDEVLHAWQGLGYYARARNLHACARVVTGQMDGRFPGEEAELAKLPGIGPYTAAAIAAIAFGRRASPVDGNVERVLTRVLALAAPPGARKAEIRAYAEKLTPEARCGDHAQALMELGALVCTPVDPDCAACPWKNACRARALGRVADFPVRAVKKPRPTRHGAAFWAERPGGEVLLCRRPERGLLGGMMGFPTTEWRDTPWAAEAAIDAAPFTAEWARLPGRVRHVFTHFALELSVFSAAAETGAAPNGIWCPPERFAEHAFPSLMKKVARHALSDR